MKSKVLTCLFTCLVATSTFAAEWTFFGTDSDRLNLYAYDREGIRKSPEGLLVWIAEINSDPKVSYDLSLQIFTFDCDSAKYRSEQVICYLRGKQKQQLEGTGKWDFAIPGSVGEAMLKNACARNKSEYVFNNGDWKELTIWGKNLLEEIKKIDSGAKSSR